MKSWLVLQLVGGVAILLLGSGVVAQSRAPQSHHAPKTIVVNDDGFSAFYSGAYESAEAIRKKILAYRDTHVAVFEWCIMAGSRVNYPSKVSELPGEGLTEFPRRGDKKVSETLHRLATQGVDTLQTVASACHEAGILCYASMRMNGDYPARWMGEGLTHFLNSKFWHQHPEFRIRGPKGQDLTKLSYAFAEVRQFRLRILREVVQRDVDGVNLDYLRHPPFLGYEEPLQKAFQAKYGQDPRQLKADDPRWLRLRCDVMTDFVRSVRLLLDEEGKRKGRRLGLSARVDWREYRQWGCDIERWMNDGLVDYLVLAQHTLGGYQFDLAPFVKMAKGTGCAVYFGEEAVTSGHDRTPEEDKAIAAGKMKPPPGSHLSLKDYAERARKWYGMGANGIHVFNDHNNLPVLRVLGDPAKLSP
jgi:hypothetical protein